MRREVAGVHLVLGPDGALDRPPHVQPKPHLHLVVGDTLKQGLHGTVGAQLGRLVEHGHDDDEGGQGVVGHLVDGVHLLFVHLIHRPIRHLLDVAVLDLRPVRQLHWKSPHAEERVADVFVGGPAVHVHLHVHDLCDGVHKLHRLLLQDLGDLRKLADGTEPEDCQHLVAGHHGVELRAAVFQRLRHNQRPRLSETNGDELVQLTKGLLEEVRLVRVVRVVLLEAVTGRRRAALVAAGGVYPLEVHPM
mmetsp:Transcript_14076/g.23812  ORF Transcript_14076/g.23812 Transcript_14076/m.23812 type:complete len:248 (-) Transcript_14076:1481-2224(-)